ncbi:branched-chain amino acid ABC transporter permease [Undibacterium fentianense]|uniref:Branched-chain amino acid ABC transporter permease n=1 Tax=Undibacterium fentianense TaxID=2828728 RepID=A0A941IB28_9BURK|nr:branched-chain amino acid ABC transporter permease [Undibacterium fentianense]MBR7798574.1 branched-chain amino acid ABC transporter permease [Undibacterium fentianense]
MEFFLINLCNGLSYGLLLFMLSAGLTLTFSFLGVLNFAHASFYMLGAYLGYSLTQTFGFAWGIVFAPLLTATLGILVERFALRHVHAQGQLAELLFTFGLSYLILECVQLIWGRVALPYRIPESLQASLFTIYDSPFTWFRGLIVALALGILLSMLIVIRRTQLGLIMQAALGQPQMLAALGYDVPTIFMWVFGFGCGLAGLAGTLGGCLMVTEPNMASSLGSIAFVLIVMGGIGTLKGVFFASLCIGIFQTFAVTVDASLLDLVQHISTNRETQAPSRILLIRVADVAPMLPILLLLLILLWRPHGFYRQSHSTQRTIYF